MLIREVTENIEKQILSKYATLAVNTKGRVNPQPLCDIRTEFQRDRDKIIHSKAFRRLKHKTQVFITPMGDHYRTRLTHTLEVSQIARTIARALRLNEDLTEAIALAHDLGHTPFGHTGEAILNEISPKGFKHYKQSLRVLEVLENGVGMNATYEVRDGVVNHTGDHQASTLEGKIIKFADRFAYINHDIDDSIRAGILTNEDIPKEYRLVLGERHSKRINTLINDIIENSMDKPDLYMSENVQNAMMGLRKFLFENVYSEKSTAKTEEQKARHVVSELYNYFTKNKDSLPDDVKPFLEKYSVDEVVCDYISGMSDRYAIHVFNNLFIPKAWNIY